jgi:uncharacterized protein YdhG (YjbR/CyaY superfamily)
MNPRHNSDDLGMLSLCSATFFPTAFKNHIGFYPAPTGIERFKEELSAYKGAKGSVRFPPDEPIPYALISEIVQFRVRENLKRGSAGGPQKKSE